MCISTHHSWFVWHRTLLRYFFPPDFRIPKDSVNTMSAEDLVAFPIVSTDHHCCYTEVFKDCLSAYTYEFNCRKSISSSMRPDCRVCVIPTRLGRSHGHELWRRRAAGQKPNFGNLRRNSANSEPTSSLFCRKSRRSETHTHTHSLYCIYTHHNSLNDFRIISGKKSLEISRSFLVHVFVPQDIEISSDDELDAYIEDLVTKGE